MRSFLILGSAVVVVTLMVLNGVLPRQAGATGSAQDAHGDDGPLELRYVDFEDESPPVFRRHDHDIAETDPDEEPEAAEPPVADEGDTGEPEAGADEDWGDSYAEPAQPVADAGPDRVLWVALNEIPLAGGESRGDGLTYSWKQVGGPHELNIADPVAAATTASGFPLEWGIDWDDAVYEFELTVSDIYGQQSVDYVQFEVKAAPVLSITPRPRRELAQRDGYLLAHYESWATNRTDSAETFEIRSRLELFLQHLGGDTNYELTVTQRRRGYLYRLTVYYQEGQSTSWLEFFADTDERIPAILQFGVNWD